MSARILDTHDSVTLNNIKMHNSRASFTILDLNLKHAERNQPPGTLITRQGAFAPACNISLHRESFKNTHEATKSGPSINIALALLSLQHDPLYLIYFLC